MLVGMGGVGVSVASAEEDATAVDTSAVIEPQAGQQEVEPAETASESQTKQQDEDQAERPDEEQTKQQTEPNGVASEQGDAAKSNDVASEQDDADSIQSITQPDDQPIVLAAQPTALANQIQPAAESETGSQLLEETFKNSNFADPDSWSIKDGACLTAKTRGCTKTTDSAAIQGHKGNGYLQLTDNSASAKGSVLYNQPIISKNGLHVSFDYYMYYSQRTGSGLSTPGDGIGFFLVDGAATLQQTGAAGAGLGYATNDEDGTGRKAREEGVAQGVLGIGLDRFGNFSTQHASGTTNRVTGGNDCGQWKNSTGSNSITVRGKGSMDSDRKWTKGYCIVTSKQVANGLGTKAATNAANDTNGKRVDITIAPLANATATTQKLTVKIDGATVLEYDIDRLPDSVKFGFSASTGAAHQVQLIRGLSVYSMKQLSQLDLVKFVDKDKYPNADTHVFQVGDNVPYKFVVRNSGNTRLNNITVNDPHIENVTCGAQILAPGAQTQCSGTLTITESLVGENGTFTNTATATATDANNKTITSPRAQATIHVNKPLGAPEKHKRIKKNGDGTYTLNVDVKGAASSTTVTTTQPIDFTLVLDVSGSMDNPMDYPMGPTRLEALKTAVDNFLDGAAAANKGSQSGSEPVRVGLVKFAGDKSDNVGNEMCYDGNYGKYYNCSQVVSDLATDMDGLKTTVDQLTAGGATRADYGFQYASKVMDKARTNAKKVVIFFTDGKPTSKSDFNTSVADSAVTAAKKLKSAGATVYSIGIFSGANPSSIESDENRFMHAVSSNFPEATAYDKLSDGDKDAGYYKAAKNASELNAIFDEIQKSETTTSAYTNVVMEDTLSEYVDLADKDYKDYKVVAKDSSGQAVILTKDVDYTLTYDENAKKFTVRFLKALAHNVTYTLEYNVKPTQKAYDEYADNLNAGQGGYGTVKGDTDTDLPGNATSSKQQGFHSNDSACLTYTADGKTHECKDNPYSHPVIQVVSSTLRIDKKWNGDGPKPENITVDIKQGNDTYKRVTLKRDDSGKWSTDVIIPAGAQKTYTVTEVEPDSHLWKASYQNKVGDGNLANSNVVTVPKSEASQNATVVITNTLKQATLKNAIGVKKELVGRDWKNSDEFTFKLKADGSNPNAPMPSDCKDKPSCTVTVKKSSSDHTAFFGGITYDAGEAEYTYLVTENAGNASAMYYSQAEYRVVVSVMKDETSGEWKAVVKSVTQLKTDYGAAGSNWDSTRPMLFTNKYISASSLPLTGRMGAERWWQLAASGVGVLALLAVVAADQWRRKKRLG